MATSPRQLKNSEVRAHVLREFYDQEMRGEFRGLDLAELAKRIGVPVRQVQVALKYLVDMGLLNGQYVLGTDVPIVMGITALGMDVIDDPQKFLGRFEINQQTVEIMGPNYGQIAQGQQGSMIGQTQALNTFEEAERLIDARDGVSSPEKEQLKTSVKEIDFELKKDRFSVDRIKTLLGSLRKYEWLYPLIVNLVERSLKSLLSPSGTP